MQAPATTANIDSLGAIDGGRPVKAATQTTQTSAGHNHHQTSAVVVTTNNNNNNNNNSNVKDGLVDIRRRRRRRGLHCDCRQRRLAWSGCSSSSSNFNSDDDGDNDDDDDANNNNTIESQTVSDLSLVGAAGELDQSAVAAAAAASCCLSARCPRVVGADCLVVVVDDAPSTPTPTTTTTTINNETQVVAAAAAACDCNASGCDDEGIDNSTVEFIATTTNNKQQTNSGNDDDDDKNTHSSTTTTTSADPCKQLKQTIINPEHQQEKYGTKSIEQKPKHQQVTQKQQQEQQPAVNRETGEMYANYSSSSSTTSNHRPPTSSLADESQQQQHHSTTGCLVATMDILHKSNSNSSSNNNNNNTQRNLAAASGGEDRLSAPPPPSTYPNNTLIADLNKCHRNIASFWPQQTTTSKTTATATTFANSLKSCWPQFLFCSSSSSSSSSSTNNNRRLKSQHKKFKKSRYKFQMPELLLRTNLKLKLDDYDKALSVLTSDVRYQLHLLLYRRVQTIWLFLTTILCIVVPILFVHFEILAIVCACLVWLGLQALGVVVTTRFRQKLDEMLEKSVAQVNTFFMDHNLMLGVINVGSLLSKTRLIIPILYFDTSQCREQIESIISIDSRKDAGENNNENLILDYSKIDLPLRKPDAMAFAQSQLAKKIVLRYSQRWISYFDKRKLMFTDDRTKPRHLSTGKCLCQFIEEHFNNTNAKEEHSFDTHVAAAASEKHNQQAEEKGILATNSYAITKATLLFNGKQQKQHEEQKEQDSQVIPQVIRNDDNTHSSPAILPTLSRLVSLEEKRNHSHHHYQKSDPTEQQQQQQHIRVNMDYYPELQQTTPKKPGNTQVNGFTWNSLGQEEQQQQQKVSQQQEQQLLSSELVEQTVNKAYMYAASQSPTSSPDISLEIGNDLIGRSDDLVKKLRLLLELRKNELQNIDGPLFSAVLYKAPHQFFLANDEQSNNNNNNHSQDESNSNNRQNKPAAAAELDGGGLIKNHKVNSAATGSGKKFYNQREGLFFLGSGGSKKSQQQQQQQETTNRNQVLEIC